MSVDSYLLATCIRHGKNAAGALENNIHIHVIGSITIASDRYHKLRLRKGGHWEENEDNKIPRQAGCNRTDKHTFISHGNVID